MSAAVREYLTSPPAWVIVLGFEAVAVLIWLSPLDDSSVTVASLFLLAALLATLSSRGHRTWVIYGLLVLTNLILGAAELPAAPLVLVYLIAPAAIVWAVHDRPLTRTVARSAGPPASGNDAGGRVGWP